MFENWAETSLHLPLAVTLTALSCNYISLKAFRVESTLSKKIPNTLLLVNADHVTDNIQSWCFIYLP